MFKYGPDDLGCNPPNVFLYVSSRQERLVGTINPPDNRGDEFDSLQCHLRGQHP